MTPAEALQGSIEIWTNRAAGKDDHRDCPLCDLYISRACNGCPVYKRTGRVWCGNTPFEKWRRLAWAGRGDHPQAIEAAQAELAFLKSLTEPTE